MVSQNLLEISNADKNSIKNITTDDEMCVYGYDEEVKMQLLEWVDKMSAQPKKHIRAVQM